MGDVGHHCAPSKGKSFKGGPSGFAQSKSNLLAFKRILDIGRFVHDHGGIPHLELVKQQMHAYCDMVGRVASDNAGTAFVPCQVGSNHPGELLPSVSSSTSVAGTAATIASASPSRSDRRKRWTKNFCPRPQIGSRQQ